jgi:ABC-type transport system involved in cytochrome bd biosynthesis fused ATPase/permease subunit
VVLHVTKVFPPAFKHLISVLTSDSIVEATAAMNRIISIRPSKAETRIDAALLPSDQQVGLEFKDVNFTYKGRDIPVIQGINIKVEITMGLFS